MSVRSGLRELIKEAKLCSEVETIEEINSQYDYEDEKPKGKGDSQKVACGQNGDYNELEYIYETKLQRFVTLKVITEKEAVRALCEACKEIKNPRSRQDFYEFLEKKLGITL